MCPHISLKERTQIRNLLQKWLTKKYGNTVFFHFPKDRNCDVCLTKITRSPCRRRQKGYIPRAEKFGEMLTKIVSEGCESRNNHRYAVVVQVLATRWIQSDRFKTRTSHQTESSLRKFLEPLEKPKVIHTDNSLEFGQACQAL